MLTFELFVLVITPLPILQELDPSILKPQRKSRFDAPAPTPSQFATGANCTPIGDKPTIVLNKYSISRLEDPLMFALTNHLTL